MNERRNISMMGPVDPRTTICLIALLLIPVAAEAPEWYRIKKSSIRKAQPILVSSVETIYRGPDGEIFK